MSSGEVNLEVLVSENSGVKVEDRFQDNSDVKRHSKGSAEEIYG